MTDRRLPAVAVRQGDRTILRAPQVGIWRDSPRDGVPVRAGDPIGTLRQLARRSVLVVPEGVEGVVGISPRASRAVAVEYGERLLEILPLSAAAAAGEGPTPQARFPQAMAETALHVTAPTDGVFYRAPASGAAPYVAPGQTITAGQPIGLIEVMKTFNPIAYGGEGLPAQAVVVAIVVADGAEVRAGQPLLSVKPL
jgi:biotin carboxyl carrier protein